MTKKEREQNAIKSRARLEEYSRELEAANLSFASGFIALGRLLWTAEHDSDLSPADYKVLLRKARNFGHNKSTMTVAVAVFLHENPDEKVSGDEATISPVLANRGVAHSKILWLSDADKKKITAGVPFDVVTDKGEHASKSWEEMTDTQRNRMVSKGGKILSIADQGALLSDSPHSRNFPWQHIDVVRDEIQIKSRNKRFVLDGTIENFVSQLDSNEWLKFVSARKKMEKAAESARDSAG